jgi:apolipoprotein D and lipocalin family protein
MAWTCFTVAQLSTSTARHSLLRRCRASLAILAMCIAAGAAALTPVPDFDPHRYFGTWYEIAAIPGFLQSRCSRDTRAEYKTAENGSIASLSRCLRADGSEETGEGRQRALDPAVPAALKVTNVHLLGIWWYPFGRESIVIAVAPDYHWLVVGHPSLRYGRVLARAPLLGDDALRAAATAIGAAEFDVCMFVTTPQTGGRDRASRLCDIVQ